jgi:hypothetical protein
MDGLDFARFRTSLNRAPSAETPAERDEKQRVLHQDLLDNHGAVVLRLDQEPGCWADRMLFARGRIIVIRLEKLTWLPVFVGKYLIQLAKDDWKRKAEVAES